MPVAPTLRGLVGVMCFELGALAVTLVLLPRLRGVISTSFFRP